MGVRQRSRVSRMIVGHVVFGGSPPFSHVSVAIVNWLALSRDERRGAAKDLRSIDSRNLKVPAHATRTKDTWTRDAMGY